MRLSKIELEIVLAGLRHRKKYANSKLNTMSAMHDADKRKIYYRMLTETEDLMVRVKKELGYTQ